MKTIRRYENTHNDYFGLHLLLSAGTAPQQVTTTTVTTEKGLYRILYTPVDVSHQNLFSVVI